jgi:Family of unknown function (DUF5343)
MEPQTQASFVPPYNIPWTTFLSTLERIAADPPGRVDRSYLDSQSGNVQTYLIAALKSFGLIDQDARPTRINEFADPSARKPKMAELLREHYPTLVELGTTRATNDELREEFSKAFPGLTGESRTKAIRFFLSGMAYAELPVSSLWQSVKAPRGASAKSGTRKAAPRKATRANNNGGTDQGNTDSPTVPPVAAALTEEQMRAAYFQLLLRKAESDDSMLDRIELLVGLGSDKKPNRGRKPAGSKPATPTDPGSQEEE